MPEPLFDPDPPSASPLDVLTGSVGKGDPPAGGQAPAKSLDDLTGGSDAQYDAITKADLALTKQKIGAEGGMAAIQKRQDDAYAQRQERMLAAEGATMDDLKPWNAEKELSKRETNLWEQFGSPGFVISMLASAFTAMPMNSALNAGAAAMNAINQGKMEDYHKAFDAWKENSNLTLKRLDIEEHEFNQIGDLRSRNMESWRAQATALAARFNDKRLQILLENGMDAQALDAIDAKAKSKVELADARQRLLQNDIRMGLINADPDYKSGDPKKMVAALHRVDDAMQNDDPTKMTPDQRFQYLWHKQNPDGTYQEFSKAYDEFKAGQYGARGMGPAAQDIPQAIQQWTDARGGNAPTPEMQSLIKAAYSTKGATAGPAIAKVGAALEEIKERIAKGETLDDDAQEKILRDATRQATSAVAGGLLSDQDAKVMAEQYLAGDKSVFTNLGRGGQGPQNVVKVRHAIMDEARARGMSGDDIALRMAEFAGLTSGERALGTRTANVEMFAGEAYKMMDVARKASLDVPRGEFVPVNRALLSFERNTGDPKVVAFGAAINTLVNTYAKAIAGGGQATVSDKDHAREMLETAFSEEQFEAVLNTLGQELEAARQAPGAVKQGFRDLAGNKNLQGNIGPAPNTIRYDAQGNRIQ
jgi:hypothetical protein